VRLDQARRDAQIGVDEAPIDLDRRAARFRNAEVGVVASLRAK